VGSARHLVALPNGDLLVGTNGRNVAIIKNVEGDGGDVGQPTTFAALNDNQAHGVAFGRNFVFVGTTNGVWRIPYTPCSITAPQIDRIASVRTTGPAGGHTSTSVAFSGDKLYVAVGSSCNACKETDATRATILQMNIDGTNVQTLAKRWRNSMAFAVDPLLGRVWAGGAGQDNLPASHPFEYMDHVSDRPVGSDYGWPDCEENRKAYAAGADCSNVVIPTLEFPAYSTIVGASFYPTTPVGKYRFSDRYHGGLFVGLKGSWHRNSSNVLWEPPRVNFVQFNSLTRLPEKPVDWNNSYAQWTDFFSGFQDANSNRIGRPTGVAVGIEGSLFVADDQTGNIYRIRPT